MAIARSAMVAPTAAGSVRPDGSDHQATQLHIPRTASAADRGSTIRNSHLTWLAVRRFGTDAAVDVVSEGIQRTARYAGAPQKYNATVRPARRAARQEAAHPLLPHVDAGKLLAGSSKTSRRSLAAHRPLRSVQAPNVAADRRQRPSA